VEGLPGADIVFNGNTVLGWHNALVADKATATARDNHVAICCAAGIKLDQPVGKAVITGNVFESDRDKTGFTVSGGEAVADDNRVERGKEGKPAGEKKRKP
jgi:hypothetical protein